MSALPRAKIALASCEFYLLDGYLCKNIFYIHILLFFLVFKRDFIRCVDFTRIAASKAASDDVTN